MNKGITIFTQIHLTRTKLICFDIQSSESLSADFQHTDLFQPCVETHRAHQLFEACVLTNITIKKLFSKTILEVVLVTKTRS